MLVDSTNSPENGVDLNPGSAEFANMRMRVIALENIVITLLAETSDEQRVLARQMAIYISPRAGFTAHALTLKAAAEMNHLVDRAEHFKSVLKSE